MVDRRGAARRDAITVRSGVTGRNRANVFDQVEDGPDDQGNYYTRPAMLSDAIPSPYPNDEAAKAANYGALPPDLTYMILTRRGGLDYVFSLLTGWMDPPAGVTPDEGQHFNVYFTGGSTMMPRVRRISEIAIRRTRLVPPLLIFHYRCFFRRFRRCSTRESSSTMMAHRPRSRNWRKTW